MVAGVQDPVLQGLIGTAITNNYDLKQAVARVEQARDQAAVANSAFFPQIGYGGDIGRGHNALYNAPASLNGAHRKFRATHARRRVGDRSLGPHPAFQRGRPRTISRHRRSPARRDDHFGERGGHGLFPASATGSATGHSARRNQCLRRQLSHLQRPFDQWRCLQTGNRPRRRRAGQCRRAHSAIGNSNRDHGEPAQCSARPQPRPDRPQLPDQSAATDAGDSRRFAERTPAPPARRARLRNSH